MKKLVICLVLIATAITVNSVLASASGIPFELSPKNSDDSHFIYDLLPGSEIEDTLKISNHSTEPVTVQLYPADGATGAAGGVVVENLDRNPELMGRWIFLEKEQVTVPAESAVSVNFTLRVPDEPPAGKLAAGIVAQDVQVTTGSSALSVSSVQRAVVLILGTAPGELIPDLKINHVSTGHANGMPSFGMHLSNDGTTFVNPNGRLRIEAPGGDVIEEKPVSLGLFLPRTGVIHRIRTEEFLSAGEYILDVELDYGGESPARWRDGFSISDSDVQDAVAQAERSAEADGTQSPVIVVQQAGLDPMIAIAGFSSLAVIASGAVFLIAFRRKSEKDQNN